MFVARDVSEHSFSECIHSEMAHYIDWRRASLFPTILLGCRWLAFLQLLQLDVLITLRLR